MKWDGEQKTNTGIVVVVVVVVVVVLTLYAYKIQERVTFRLFARIQYRGFRTL